jgi:hypothetical protein
VIISPLTPIADVLAIEGLSIEMCREASKLPGPSLARLSSSPLDCLFTTLVVGIGVVLCCKYGDAMVEGAAFAEVDTILSL